MDEIQVEELEQPESQDSPEPSDRTESVEHLAAARHFNIDIASDEEDGKLREIWQHAKSKSESGEIHDILWQVMHIEQTLGAPRLGETRLDKLYRYAKLRRQQQMIEQELRNV